MSNRLKGEKKASVRKRRSYRLEKSCLATTEISQIVVSSKDDVGFYSLAYIHELSLRDDGVTCQCLNAILVIPVAGKE